MKSNRNQLPADLESEMATLGCMLLSEQAIAEVNELISGPSDFASQKHATIYESIMQVYEKGASIDLVVLCSHMVERKTLEAIGGVAYLEELYQAVPTASNASWYAKRVASCSVRLRLMEAANRIIDQCDRHTGTTEELLELAGQEVFGISSKDAGKFQGSVGDVIAETMEQMCSRDGHGLTGVRTKFTQLDEMLNGLHPGELIILAARPSMGKSALMLNMVENIGLAGTPVGIFSLEMSREQLAMRMLSSQSGVDGNKMRKNRQSQEEFDRMYEVSQRLGKSPIHIDDTPGLTHTQLRMKARDMVRKHDIKVLFVDYLQLMTGPKSSNRAEEVTAISRSAKALARELEIPIVALCQLNRANEANGIRKPRMSDLRESGAIEQDADVIGLLHREDYYHKSDPDYEHSGQTDLIIEKQRNGPTGTVKLTWDAKTTRFSNG